jgi:hypothetical protein
LALTAVLPVFVLVPPVFGLYVNAVPRERLALPDKRIIGQPLLGPAGLNVTIHAVGFACGVLVVV